MNKITYVFLVLCLLCVSQYFGITVLNLAFTVAIVVISCLADVDELFVIMYATLPLYNLISLRTGTYSMHYLIIGIFIVKHLLSSKVSAVKLLTFLTLFILRIFAKDFVLLISWSLLILPLILTLDDDIWIRNIRRILFWVNLSLILSCVTGYMMMVMQKSIYTTAYLYISGVRTVRFAGVTGDSIVFGQTCALTIGMNLTYCYFNPNTPKKFYVISSLLLAIAALLSFSKMTLICILVVFAIFLALYGKAYVTDRKRVIKAVAFSGALIVLISISVFTLVNYSGNSTVILGYIDRFTRDDLTTGRFSLWSVYLRELTESPKNLILPLTSGELSAQIWNPSTGSYVAYVHNLYLETVAVFGWCAAILIFVWVGARIYGHFARGSKFILAVPALILLVMGFGSHGNLEYQFYLQFALALSFLNPNMERALQANHMAPHMENCKLRETELS
jgi:hypothetical protein